MPQESLNQVAGGGASGPSKHAAVGEAGEARQEQKGVFPGLVPVTVDQVWECH